MTIHISLDLETWGTTPGSDIRSIGATVFDPVTGYVMTGTDDDTANGGSFYAACDNPVIGEGPDWIETLGFRPNIIDPCFDEANGEYRKYPLTRDPRTVQWWSEQSAEAQAAFADPVDLREALERFTSWLVNILPEAPTGPTLDIRIWSHGAAFDPPILAAAYEACGLTIPWHYRAPRDTRTLFDVAGIDDHTAWLEQHPGPFGVAHHALDDSICQARAVCAAYRRVRHVETADIARADQVDPFAAGEESDQ